MRIGGDGRRKHRSGRIGVSAKGWVCNVTHGSGSAGRERTGPELTGQVRRGSDRNGSKGKEWGVAECMGLVGIGWERTGRIGFDRKGSAGAKWIAEQRIGQPRSAMAGEDRLGLDGTVSDRYEAEWQERIGEGRNGIKRSVLAASEWRGRKRNVADGKGPDGSGRNGKVRRGRESDGYGVGRTGTERQEWKG